MSKGIKYAEYLQLSKVKNMQKGLEEKERDVWVVEVFCTLKLMKAAQLRPYITRPLPRSPTSFLLTASFAAHGGAAADRD